MRGGRVGIVAFVLASCLSMLPIAGTAWAQATNPHANEGSGNTYSKCEECHVGHTSQPSNDFLLKQSNVCNSCHIPAGGAPVVSTHQTRSCESCHNPHKSTNLHLVKTTVDIDPDSLITDNQPVILTDSTGVNSYADGDTTYNGICEVCHTTTKYHRNDGSGQAHNDAQNCFVSDCHAHDSAGNAFLASCTSCHAEPPLSPVPWVEGNDGENYSGGAGAHATHMAILSSETDPCDHCHFRDGTAGNEHNEGSGTVLRANVDVVPDTTAYPTGSYDMGLAQCSNIWCHSDGVGSREGYSGSPAITYANTPAWTATSACDDCHSDSPTTGSHATHLTATPDGPGATCSTCHGVGTDPPDNTNAGHVDGDVDFADGQPLSTTAVCNTCHGITDALSKPTWGDPSTVTCLQCHDDAVSNGGAYALINGITAPDPDEGSPSGTDYWTTSGHGLSSSSTYAGSSTDSGAPNNGANLTDVNLDGSNDCWICHDPNSTGKYNGALSAGPNDNRLNMVDTNHDVAGFQANVDTLCVGCHGQGGTASTFATSHVNPDTTVVVNCINCHDPHGTSNIFMIRKYAPQDQFEACRICHGTEVYMENELWADVRERWLVGGRSEGWGAGAVSGRSATGSAETGRAVWDGDGPWFAPDVGFLQVDFTDITQMDLPDTSATNDLCAQCHTDRVKTAHDGGPGSPGHGAADYRGTDCTLCHTHDFDGDLSTNDAFMQDEATGGCSACHGDQSAQAYFYPDDLPASTFPDRDGSHTFHAGTESYDCEVCHPNPGEAGHEDGYPGSPNPPADLHQDGSNQSTFFALFGSVGNNDTDAAYNNGTSTCTAVECHGDGLTQGSSAADPVWGSPGTAACGTCHAITAADQTSGSHQKHINDAQGPQVDCLECHWDNNTTHSTRDGAITFADGATQLGTDNASGTAECNYCHWDATGVTLAKANWVAGTTLGCDDCHDDETVPAVSNTMSDPHVRHVIDNSIDCNACHSSVVNTGKVIGDYTLHTNGSVQVSISATYDNNGGTGEDNWNSGTNTCSSTVCHASQDRQWYTTGVITDCGGCHGTSPTTTGEPPVDLAGLSDSYEVGKHADHISVSQANTSTDCGLCHEGAGAGTAQHYDGTVDINFNTAAGTSANWVDSGVNQAPGGECQSTDCHGASNRWDPNLTSGCTGCHSGAKDGGDGGPTRRAIVGDFARTSHHVTDGTSSLLVTNQDCAVCHLEGSPTTGERNDTYHQNNRVDLRDPDTGAALTGAGAAFVTFSRDTTSAALEDTVTAVQNQFCFGCHDSDGATADSSKVSGATDLQPFSVNSRNATDVFSQFDTANNSHHAVRGAGANEFCTSTTTNGNVTTMEPPWNQGGAHDVISCFDCHFTNIHGSDNTDALLRNIATGTGIASLCQRCHKSSIYTSGGSGSDASTVHQRSAHHGDYDCMNCHGNFQDLSADGIDNGATQGAIHGSNYVWPSNAKTPNIATDVFMFGGFLSGQDVTARECYGGACNHASSPKTY